MVFAGEYRVRKKIEIANQISNEVNYLVKDVTHEEDKDKLNNADKHQRACGTTRRTLEGNNNEGYLNKVAESDGNPLFVV